MIKQMARRVRDFLNEPTLDALARVPRPPDAATQIQLRLAYGELVRRGGPFPCLRDTGFKCYSQADEDGILLYLLSVIGAPTRLAVEICAGDGIECNTANLTINHGWHSLLVDGDQRLVARGQRFYAESRDTCVFPPRFVCSWITRDNVNGLLRDNGFAGDIDLLSLDLDGVDYWIWDAIDVIQPRIVVAEYQDILGPSRSWTVPYSDAFSSADTPRTKGMPNFVGASLMAFVKLGKAKGYRLVGTNRYGYNAFFVRNDLAPTPVPEVDPRTCFGHPKVLWGMRERFPTVESHPWVEV